MSGPPPLAESIAGYLIVYVMFPLAVIGTAAIAAAMWRFNRRLTLQDKALAVLVAEVDGGKDELSLRQLMRAIEHSGQQTREDLSSHIAVAEERWSHIHVRHDPPGGTTP